MKYGVALILFSSMTYAMENNNRIRQPELAKFCLPTLDREIYHGFLGEEFKTLAAEYPLLNFHFIGCHTLRDTTKKFCYVYDSRGVKYVTFSTDKKGELKGFHYVSSKDGHFKTFIEEADATQKSDFVKVQTLYYFILDYKKNNKKQLDDQFPGIAEKQLSW